MAKKKMTLEEKLEEAVVKDVPYEVTENWVWVKLDSISTLVTGNTPSKKNEVYYGESIPFIKPNDLEQGRRLKSSIEMLSDLGGEKARVLPRGATAVCCIGSIGKAAYLEVEGATNQQINSIIPNKIDNLYIYYYVLSEYFQRELLNNSSATTIAIINKSKMGELAVPIPPLKEQERIVNKIESLFEKLDKAKELIEEARDDFEKRKVAVLEKAFRGELTEEWRNNRNLSYASELILLINRHKKDLLESKTIRKEKELPKISSEEIMYNIPKTWEWVRLGDIANKITDGTHKTPNYLDKGIPFLSAKDIKGEKIIFDNCKFISDDEYKEMNNRCNINKGTILVSKSGTIGNVAVVTQESEFGIFESLAVINTIDKLDSHYIAYALKTILFSEKDKYIKGTGVKHLHLNSLKNIVVPLPPTEEQKEIVRILEILLEKESKIEEFTKLEEQIELIKKSILAKAFRGELGTNSAEEESALELLKEILAVDH